MRLWRLSTVRFADVFDGGYGLRFEGRWNRVGRPVTYCATSPSLCVLEKLVHLQDPDLLPALAMVSYDVPDNVPTARLALSELPPDWRRLEIMTQQIGDEWLAQTASMLLAVPSAIVPITDSPDENVLINHAHPSIAAVTVARIEPFVLDVRLL